MTRANTRFAPTGSALNEHCGRGEPCVRSEQDYSHPALSETQHTPPHTVLGNNYTAGFGMTPPVPWLARVYHGQFKALSQIATPLPMAPPRRR